MSSSSAPLFPLAPSVSGIGGGSGSSLNTRSGQVRNTLTGGVIFFLLSLPAMNQVTNHYIGRRESKCPSMYTRVFHTLLYMLVMVFLIVQFSFLYVPWGRVLTVSSLSALLFFFLASPDMYNFTNMLLRLNNDPGCPNSVAIALHSVVFMFVTHYLMCTASV